MKSIVILFIVFNAFNFSISKKLDYRLVFEYLYSDEKDIFEIELYNRPKTSSLDFSEEIFYSGTIEKIENFPINKLVNFTKEDFNKNKNKEKEKIKTKEEKENESNEENIIKEEKNKNDNYDDENVNINNNEDNKNLEEKINEEYSENEYDIYDNLFFEEPFIRMIFDNDYNKYINFIKQQHLQNQNLNKNKEKKQYNQPYIQIIHPSNNYNFPIIKIIKYPNDDRYKTTKTNNSNLNYQNNEYDPFDFYNEFNPFDFGFNNIFKSMESELNRIYRGRLLSEKNDIEKKEISKQKMFSTESHNIVYISNKLYFDYIKYLPKSTIILTQRQFAKDLLSYQDYYIFTIKNGIALSSALTRSESTYYKVKIGQNFKNSNIILISLGISMFLCLISYAIYSYFLKHNEEEDILPVQNLINKFPQYLCLLNILMYFSFISSYNDTDGYFMIVKFVSLFLYSLFKSMFLCILILLLNGWMTLTFIAWAQKLNKAIPIIFFEIVTSISFEIIGFYDIIPYNKLQLYYFRDIFENMIIISLALYSINKFYIPLNKKCKYLSLIDSDFNEAYNLKKKKMISFSIFGVIYGASLILSDYFEFDYIYKYLQNNTLHVIREIIFMCIFNFILMILLLPKELPYLFTEETDLKKCEYLLSDLNQKNILEVNDGEIKNIKKQLDKKENVQIILVNPFYGNKNQNDKFEELHLGNATYDN